MQVDYDKIISLPETSVSFQCAHYYRPKDCSIIISEPEEMCTLCLKHVNKSGSLSLKLEPVKLKAPLSITSPDRLKLTIQQQKNQNKTTTIRK